MKVRDGIPEIKCIGGVAFQCFLEFNNQGLFPEFNRGLFVHRRRDNQFLIRIVKYDVLVKSDLNFFGFKAGGVIRRIAFKHCRRGFIAGTSRRASLLGAAPESKYDGKNPNVSV